MRLFTVIAVSLFAAAASADLESALREYAQSGNGIAAQLEVMRDNAGSCGFIGRMVAGRMAESIQQQRRQIAVVSAAARRGPAGRAEIEQQLRAAEDGNGELRSSQSMIRNGLSTDTPTCRKASVAFERMVVLSFGVPEKIRRVISEL